MLITHVYNFGHSGFQLLSNILFHHTGTRPRLSKWHQVGQLARTPKASASEAQPRPALPLLSRSHILLQPQWISNFLWRGTTTNLSLYGHVMQNHGSVVYCIAIKLRYLIRQTVCEAKSFRKSGETESEAFLWLFPFPPCGVYNHKKKAEMLLSVL